MAKKKMLPYYLDTASKAYLLHKNYIGIYNLPSIIKYIRKD